MPTVCRRFFVTGTVQGVFFRDSTRRKAIELNLTGWVRNVADGRVELVACGEPEAVNTLATWLWEGPPAAEVINVTEELQEMETHSEFEILR